MYEINDAKQIDLKDKAVIVGLSGLNDYLTKHPGQNGENMLVVSDSFTKDSDYCILSHEPKIDSYYILAISDLDMEYIAFILNSSVGKFLLSHGAAKYINSGKVTTTSLKSFRYIEIPDGYKTPCATLGRLIGYLNAYSFNNVKNNNLDFIRPFLNDIRDAIVMEIYFQKIFKNYKIRILDNWINELDRQKYSSDNSNDTTVELLMVSIFSENNLLLENMKQFRMLINSSSLNSSNL